MTLLIRRATIDDADTISALVHSVAHYFTIHADGRGAEEFFKSITSTAIRGYLTSDQYVYWLGCDEQNHVIAAIALRDNSHLYHLFVASEQQSQGYARQLWQHLQTHAAQNGNPGNFTVNASLFAEKCTENLALHQQRKSKKCMVYSLSLCIKKWMLKYAKSN